MRTKMIAVASVAACLQVSWPALADEPFSTKTPSQQPVAGRLDNATDVDRYGYDILVLGNDYMLAGTNVGARVIGPNGNELARSLGSDLDWAGDEFRVMRSGRHVVVLGPDGTGRDYPAGYLFRITSDCADRADTQCALKLGVTQTRTLAASVDHDRFRVSLTGGRSYAVVVDAHGLEPMIQLLNREDRVLAGSDVPEDAQGRPVLTFRAPATGTFWVRVIGNDDALGAYQITLSAR